MKATIYKGNNDYKKRCRERGTDYTGTIACTGASWSHDYSDAFISVRARMTRDQPDPNFTPEVFMKLNFGEALTLREGLDRYIEETRKKRAENGLDTETGEPV